MAEILISEARRLTNLDANTARTAVESACLMDGFVAEFVAESESLEGCDASPADVLDSVRDLVLIKIGWVMTRAGSAALALAFAAALALPTPARAYNAADGEQAQRMQAQCNAAQETVDAVGMRVYCANAAEAWSLFTSGIHKTENWATLRTAQADDLLAAASAESHSDLALSKRHMVAAMHIMDDVVERFPSASRKAFQRDLHAFVVRFVETDATSN